MPTYDYVCEKCGLQFEKFQSMNDARLTACPKDVCGQKRWGKGKVRRILGTGAGLIFKGSGFYITDYRSENYKQGAKKDTAPTVAASESKGAADSKPAAATPAATPAAPAKSESKPAKPKAKAS
ncbi:MAG: FmdB family zinc ribbon protein [Limisphaerales bacterium]